MELKQYKKYDLVKEGDLCHVCKKPFLKYDKMAWLDKERTRPAHASCTNVHH